MDIWSESLALLPVAFLNELKKNSKMIRLGFFFFFLKEKDYADMTSRQVQV